MNLNPNTLESSIFHHPTLTSEEILLLAKVADKAYEDNPEIEGWDAITPDLTKEDYELDGSLISGKSYKKLYEGIIFDGDANATVFKSQTSDTLILAFRGTESIGDASYWGTRESFYDLFNPLFEALNKYIGQNNPSKILVTGHSLGGAMTEFFMERNKDNRYAAVAFASPDATEDPNETRILNIGHENDSVYEITSSADAKNSTTKVFTVIGSEHDTYGSPKEHSQEQYIYTTERILSSRHYDQMKKDSLVIIDRTDDWEDIFDEYPTFSTNTGAFVLGEDDDNDEIRGFTGNDVLEGLGGNDTLIGDYTSNWFNSSSGNDTLDGGAGDDSLDGKEGSDTAIFSDAFENYDYSINQGKVTFSHARGTQTDGTDTLENIENAVFSDSLVILALPIVTQITASTPTISDSTASFTLTVEYSEDMLTANPSITFPQEKPINTITFNSGSWSNDRTYIATYNVTDAGEEIADIDVKVEKAFGLNFLAQNVFIKNDLFSIDNQNPNAPSITSFSEDTDTNGDGITKDNTLIINGSAEANSSIEVFQNDNSIGTTEADDSGSWSFDYTNTSLKDGTYAFTVTAKDSVENVSPKSTTLDIVVDTSTNASGNNNSGSNSNNSEGENSAITNKPIGVEVNSTNIKFSLASFETNNASEIGLFIVDENGNIDGNTPGSDGYLKAALEQSQILFSTLANLPNGFNNQSMERIVEIEGDAKLGFFKISNGTIEAALREIEMSGNTSLSVSFIDSQGLSSDKLLSSEGFTLQSEDSEIQLKGIKTQENPVQGTKLQTQKELIDLRDINGNVSVNVEVYREASFDNLIGFYKVIDANGGIDIDGDGIADINPNEAGYKNAALNNIITGLDLLATENQTTTTVNGNLEAGSILAPFIIADGTFDEAINNNAEVYFSYLGANSDNSDHIRLLGDNTFGFEDMVNGGDKDFNDLIMKVNFGNG